MSRGLPLFACVALCVAVGAGFATAPVRAIEASTEGSDVRAYRAALDAETRRVFDPSVVPLLDSMDASLATRAALSIGRTKRPEAVMPLLAHLAATDAAVRSMCVYGLGLIADPSAVGRLESLLADDKSSAVRYAAADALGRIVAAHPESGDGVLLADLLTTVRDDADPIVRGHAAAVLDVFRTLPVADAAAAGLDVALERERDSSVRWHEMWALFRGFATKADRALLERGLHAREELVRIEAVRAWGRRLENPEAAALLKPLLEDPSWRVQLQARESLKALAKEPLTEHLVADPPGLHLPKFDAANSRDDEAALPRVPVPLATPTPAPTATPITTPGSPAATSNATSNAVAPKQPVSAVPTGPTASSTPPSTIPTAKPYIGPPTAAPGPPKTSELDLSIPLLPRTAALMNGPMPGPHPRVRLRTSAGDIVLRLYPEWAPRTVANFLALVDRGYFDGNRWFRIVPDFVDQTGDPNDNGDGDAGYTIGAEENPVEQRTGIIAMGLEYEKDHPLRDSAGTQFYLTLSPQLHLDRDFSVFGEVTSGLDVMAHLIENDRILRADVLVPK